MDKLLTVKLEEFRRQNLYREPIAFEPLDAAHAACNGDACLLLASNNYLGLTHHAGVRKAAAEAALKYGTGAGGSRLTTGGSMLCADLEQALAEFKGAEAAVVFGSGYQANVGTISALAGPGDVIFSDELNHASIIDGCRLARARTVVFPHRDMAGLAALLAATPCAGQRFIVTDGVFSMDGDIAPLDDIVRLAGRHEALVMVDDAHATGVIGPGGRGTAAHFGLKGKVDIELGTLSKALAAEGGYVAGSAALIAYLVNKARPFIYTTALAPATVAAARAALRELAADPGLVRRLRDNAAFFRGELAAAGMVAAHEGTPIIALVLGGAAMAVTMAELLRREGLIVSAIRPPTVPPGTSRLRLTVSAAHSRAELAAAASLIAAAAAKLEILRR